LWLFSSSLLGFNVLLLGVRRDLLRSLGVLSHLIIDDGGSLDLWYVGLAVWLVLEGVNVVQVELRLAFRTLQAPLVPLLAKNVNRFVDVNSFGTTLAQ